MPDLARYTIEYPFKDIYARPGLPLRDREIATIAALTAMGNAAPQLRVHIQAGLSIGLTEEEIKEIVIQMSVYAGFPAALNGMQSAKVVFQGAHSTRKGMSAVSTSARVAAPTPAVSSAIANKDAQFLDGFTGLMFVVTRTTSILPVLTFYVPALEAPGFVLGGGFDTNVSWVLTAAGAFRSMGVR